MPTEIETTFGYIRNLSDWVDIVCHILNPDRNTVAFYYSPPEEKKIKYFQQFMGETSFWLAEHYTDFYCDLSKNLQPFLYEFITDTLVSEMFGVIAITVSKYLQ